MQTDFMLDVLEQTLHARQPARDSALIHHGGRGSQYLSIRYSKRLVQAGVLASVGIRGDSCDSALAKTINGPYKGKLTHGCAPWRTRQAVELATLGWLH